MLHLLVYIGVIMLGGLDNNLNGDETWLLWVVIAGFIEAGYGGPVLFTQESEERFTICTSFPCTLKAESHAHNFSYLWLVISHHAQERYVSSSMAELPLQSTHETKLRQKDFENRVAKLRQ